MINFEISDDEADLVLKKPEKRPKEAQKDSVALRGPATGANQSTATHEIDIDAVYQNEVQRLNECYSAHQTLMPYTCTLVLDDILFKRYASIQLIAMHQNDVLQDIKMLVFKPNRSLTAVYSEVIEFETNRTEAVRKFHDLFFELTFNAFEDRMNFTEAPGKFLLTEGPNYVLHNAAKFTFTEEKLQFQSKSKFVSLKLLNYEQFENDEPQLPFERLYRLANIESFERSMQLPEGMIYRLTHSKIVSIWNVLTALSKEFKSKSVRKNITESLLSELNSAVFEKNYSAYWTASNHFEIFEIAKKVQLLVDSYHFANTLQDLYNFFSAGEPFDKYLSHAGVKAIKLDKSGEAYELIERMFANTFVCANQMLKPAVDGIFELLLKKQKRRFEPFERMNRIYLWKAFDYVSFPAFLASKVYCYPEEPGELSATIKNGISFYDSASKAIYSGPFNDRSKFFLVLFDVAVGKMRELTSLENVPPPSMNMPTLKLKGRWEGRFDGSKNDVSYASELVQTEAQTSFAYSEYVVFDTNQFLPKFILLFK